MSHEQLLRHVATCPITSYVRIAGVEEDGRMFRLACGHQARARVQDTRWGSFAPCTRCCPGSAASGQARSG
jgi:hypothetical protein